MQKNYLVCRKCHMEIPIMDKISVNSIYAEAKGFIEDHRVDIINGKRPPCFSSIADIYLINK